MAGMNCWSCARAIEAPDHYCRFCGEGQGEHVAWYYHPFSLAFLALFLMGPFALGLVWKSPKFSYSGRWIATALIMAYTAYLFFSFLAAVRLLKSITLGAF